MNLVLIDDIDLLPDGTARIDGRRAIHIREVLRLGIGGRLTVGRLGGDIGEGEVLAVGPSEVVLQVRLFAPPPPPSPVDLVLALPRPKTLRKVLQAAAAIGIGRLVLLGSYRVEKSYFASPLLEPQALREQLRLGLEQGRDTRLPRIWIHRFFKPFIEDELDALFPEGQRLLAHGAAPSPLDSIEPSGPARALLAVGPEGGWTPYETSQLEARGFTPFSLGPRPLRVDAAVPYAVGQVELWLRARLRPRV